VAVLLGHLPDLLLGLLAEFVELLLGRLAGGLVVGLQVLGELVGLLLGLLPGVLPDGLVELVAGRLLLCRVAGGEVLRRAAGVLRVRVAGLAGALVLRILLPHLVLVGLGVLLLLVLLLLLGLAGEPFELVLGVLPLLVVFRVQV